MEERTIAAIATAPGPAGVSVVRISGDEAWQVAGRVVRCEGPSLTTRRPGRFFHAQIADPATGETVDDGIILLFRSPASYTGEDVVEIQGHGGAMPSRAVLRAVLAAGARLAAPGEFTRRAFVNGRLDLTQAEAVMDLIGARSERAAQAARAQLAGTLGSSINVCYEGVTKLCAEVEARLDFSEGELPPRMHGEAIDALEALRGQLHRLLETEREGHLLRDGALVAISGCPNAGKSSLLNAFLGRNRAIVSSKPGTTRDTIEEGVVLDGIPLRLVDTAGLHETACKIGQEGVVRAHAALREADLIIYLIDGSRSFSKQHPGLFASALASDPGRVLVVRNKIDLPQQVSDAELVDWIRNVTAMAGYKDQNGESIIFPKTDASVEASITPPSILAISLMTGEGLENLKSTLVWKLGMERHVSVHPSVSERHREELTLASSMLAEAKTLLLSGDDQLVVAAEQLRTAAEALGRITGRCYTDDLLDRVFASFCIGK